MNTVFCLAVSLFRNLGYFSAFSSSSQVSDNQSALGLIGDSLQVIWHVLSDILEAFISFNVTNIDGTVLR